jgi:hypothetical protein
MMVLDDEEVGGFDEGPEDFDLDDGNLDESHPNDNGRSTHPNLSRRRPATVPARGTTMAIQALYGEFAPAEVTLPRPEVREAAAHGTQVASSAPTLSVSQEGVGQEGRQSFGEMLGMIGTYHQILSQVDQLLAEATITAQCLEDLDEGTSLPSTPASPAPQLGLLNPTSNTVGSENLPAPSEGVVRNKSSAADDIDMASGATADLKDAGVSANERLGQSSASDVAVLADDLAGTPSDKHSWIFPMPRMEA